MTDKNLSLEQIRQLENEKRQLKTLLKDTEKKSSEQGIRLQQTLEELEVRACELLNSEKAYGEQRHILESVLNSMAEGVVAVDQSGKFILFNVAAERLAGFGAVTAPPEEWAQHYGVYLSDTKTLCPSEDLPLVRAMRGDSIDEEEIFILNINKPQGIWLSVNARPLRDADGRIRGGLVVLRDITEQKRIREQVREFANYLDKIINSVADPIFVKDREHRWVLLNDACCKFMGASREDLIGKSDYDFFPKEEADIFWAKDELVFNSGIENLNEEEFTDAKGITHTIVTKKNLYADGYNQKFIVGIIRDVTEQKKTERRLTAQYTVTRLLADSSSMEEAAPKIMKELGEILGWDYAAFWLPEENEEELRCHFFWTRDTASGNAFESMTRRIRLPKGVDIPGRIWASGQAFWASDLTKDDHFIRNKPASQERLITGAGFPIRLKDNAIGVMEFFSRHIRMRDENQAHFFAAIGEQISQFMERREAERHLVEKNLELVRANSERDQLELFTFVASHDLQEPLQKIIAFGGLLKTHAVSWIDEKAKGHVEKMQLAASRMAQMIEDLLYFSKVTASSLVFETVDLEMVIGEVLSDLDLRISSSRARIEIGLLPKVWADRRQMNLLFQNLIGNAIKFSKPGQAPEIQINSRIGQGGQAEIMVRDQGIGFPPRFVEKIFRPFEKLNGRKYEGSGMGLAICKKIVTSHQGEIFASSTENEGAVFSVILPIAPEGQGGEFNDR